MNVEGEIYGFNFAFSFSPLGGPSHQGVIVPHDADLTNIEYIIALQAAMSVWERVGADVTLAQCELLYAGEKRLRLETADLERYTKMYHLLLDQEVFEPSVPAIRFGEAAKSELYRRRRIEEARSARAERKAKMSAGYVYLIQSPSSAYKIGRTKSPEDRMKTFGVQLPFEVDYVCLIETDDMIGLERELHQRYAHKRTNGEWFTLGPDDVDAIKGMAHNE